MSIYEPAVTQAAARKRERRETGFHRVFSLIVGLPLLLIAALMEGAALAGAADEEGNGFSG